MTYLVPRTSIFSFFLSFLVSFCLSVSASLSHTLLKQKGYWVAHKITRKRNTDLPKAQAQKAEPRAKSRPRTRPGGTTLFMPSWCPDVAYWPHSQYRCWTLAAAHTRIREAFQRLGMPLPGALEVMGVRKEPSWRGWGELDEALGFWFVAGNRRNNYS